MMGAFSCLAQEPVLSVQSFSHGLASFEVEQYCSQRSSLVRKLEFANAKFTQSLKHFIVVTGSNKVQIVPTGLTQGLGPMTLHCSRTRLNMSGPCLNLQPVRSEILYYQVSM